MVWIGTQNLKNFTVIEMIQIDFMSLNNLKKNINFTKGQRRKAN